MKTLVTGYTFNAASQQITFTEKSTIVLENVLVITNVTAGNVFIYNFADSTAGGTVSGNILTLTYNTTAMNNTDRLQIWYEEGSDTATLLSTTISTVSQGTAIPTVNYNHVIVQTSGASWLGTIYMESSNDKVTWNELWILSQDEVSYQDNIGENGQFTVRGFGKYIRYNAQQMTGTVTISIVGRTTPGISGADLLSLAMDKTNNAPLNVQLSQNFNMDQNGSLLASDNVKAITFTSSVAGTPIVIDTTGYTSVVIHESTAGIITPTISNDGVNYVGTVGYLSTAPGVPIAATAGAGLHVFPVLARYMKITGPTSAVVATIYLRNVPYNSAIQNIAQINGTQAVTAAGVSGMMAVGGNIGVGSAPTAGPVLTGGIDTAGKTRAILTDIAGRLQTDLMGVIGNSTTPTQVGAVPYSYQANPVLMVQDVTQNEGQSHVELLAQILLELRIMNQYIYELPRQIVTQSVPNADDSPERYRQDPTIFNI